MHAYEMHAYEVPAHEVYPHEMHARKVLVKTFRSPTLQTAWWSIYRDLSYKIRVFTVRDKRSLSASVHVLSVALLLSAGTAVE
jgi:hypothetical protein